MKSKIYGMLLSILMLGIGMYILVHRPTNIYNPYATAPVIIFIALLAFGLFVTAKPKQRVYRSIEDYMKATGCTRREAERVFYDEGA